MLARFERLMEQAVEGSLRRVFPTTLQPVQLAKAAARAMEDAQVVGLYGPEVPNRYRLRLAAADLERFGDYSTTLSRELSRYLVDYARERGLRTVAPPRVELIEAADVRPGTVRADARFVDLAPAQKNEIDAAVDGTRRLRLNELAAAQAHTESSDAAELRLRGADGLVFELDPEIGVLRIGRATDNDVVIPNQRVSRYHAQVRWVESNWLIYDLDSTNGTFADDERIFPAQPHALGAATTLRLGDHELHVEARQPRAG